MYGQLYTTDPAKNILVLEIVFSVFGTNSDHNLLVLMIQISGAIKGHFEVI